MPDPTNPSIAASHLRLPNSRTEAGSVELAPHELTQAGAFAVHEGVLTVKNQQLANLIHSKLADASKLVPSGKAATDVDVSVGVKIK